jgi:thiamine biosynthesis lipoprotein
MATDCQLTLFADSETRADHAADLAMAEVWRIESKYSRYTNDSTLTDINRAALLGKAIDIDEETAQLFDFALNAFQISGGLFDVSSGALRRVWDFSSATTPSPTAIEKILPLIGLQKITRDQTWLQFSIPGMELDFGGIGKEYAVDRCADILIDMSVTSGLIDLGGDIRSIGTRPDGKPWQIGVRHPRKQDESLGNIQLASGAVATSGDYERYIEVADKRYCHILNPLTGWPVEGLAFVSVIAEQCLLAGTLATIAMLKGNAGKEWLMKTGVQHCWVDEQLQLGGNITPSAARPD